MALIEHGLFGIEDKVDNAVNILKEIQAKELEDGEPYHGLTSGGKDSIVIEDLLKRAGVKYELHHNITTIDPAPVIYFMRKNIPDLIWHKPKTPFLHEMVNRGFPMRGRRWCCGDYKEKGGEGRILVTGIRRAESKGKTARAKRKIIETCYKDSSKTYLNPIISWSNTDVWEYIHGNSLKYCSLYDEGFERIGCLFCPLASKRKRIAEMERWPKWVKIFKKYFQWLYEAKKAKGSKAVDRWRNGEEMFYWWIHEEDQYQIIDEGLFQ